MAGIVYGKPRLKKYYFGLTRLFCFPQVVFLHNLRRPTQQTSMFVFTNRVNLKTTKKIHTHRLITICSDQKREKTEESENPPVERNKNRISWCDEWWLFNQLPRNECGRLANEKKKDGIRTHFAVSWSNSKTNDARRDNTVAGNLPVVRHAELFE